MVGSGNEVDDSSGFGSVGLASEVVGIEGF